MPAVPAARSARSVCVVGGGIAGLAAARRLRQRGASVVLVEPSRLGGRIATSSFAGRPVDEGPDAFLARVPAAVTLATELGLGPELVAPAQRSAFVYVNDRLHPIPPDTVLGVPTDLRTLLASQICSRAGVGALRRDVDQGSDPLAGPDVAIGGHLRARLGDEVTDRLVAPLVGGINAGDIDRLSLAAVTPQLDAAARSDRRSLVRACAAQRAAALAGRRPDEPAPAAFLTPRSGLGTLVDALVTDLRRSGVEVRIGVQAGDLTGRGSGWSVSLRATDDGDATRSGAGVDAEVLDVEAVVLATPAPVSARLLDDVAPTAAAELGSIEHAGVALTTLAFDPATVECPLEGSGYLVPRTAGLLLTAASWSSAKWEHLAPRHGDGTVLVRASAGRLGDERALARSDAALIARLLDDLRTTMGGLGEPIAARVSRYPASFPQYAPGHLDRISRAEADLAARAPGVALAGAALRGVGIPACIASGQAAAEHLTGA